MKQKILIGIFVVIMYVVLLIPNQSLAETQNNEYTIQSYNINMVVNEDNTFDITENITAYFNVQKHGIYRKIPLKNSITRTDGTKSSNRAKITDISVNENYTTYNENGDKVIQIGDENKVFTGLKSYTIKYKYDIGKDPLKDADELYFNLIGSQWDTSISNVSFTITMPKSFDQSLLGFSSGGVGSTDSSNVIYSVNGNTIEGNTINTLNAGQALTVRLTLPEGYFVGASSNIDIFSIIVIVLCVVCVLIVYMLWLKYGKDDPVVETVEFYPPEGYNSAEVGFLYNGSADTEGVISLLIYLANKGYLEIEETEEKMLFTKSKGFKITKLKEYDGNNESEKMFLEGLFKNTSTNSVTSLDLYNNFYITLNMIKSKLNSKENKNKIFTKASRGKVKYIILMAIAIFILITVKPIMEYSGIGELIVAILFPRNRIFDINRRSYRCYKNA